MWRRCWQARWNVARLAVASVALWAVAVDTGPRLARLALMNAPGFDYAAEVVRLRDEGRFGEALVVADAGLADGEFADRTTLERERGVTVEAQSSWLRRLKDAGWGALTGTAGPSGASVESLAGAIAADMLVVGDVRDLLIQGAKLAVDGEADPVILALSGAGIALTVAPQMDWAPSLLKVARKTGSMGRGVGAALADAAKSGNARVIEGVIADAGALGAALSPGGALRVLRLADDPAELGRAAAFASRQAKAGRGAAAGFALHVTGGDGVKVLASAAEDAVPAAERAVLMAARKGEAGRAWLRTAAKTALRPHPLLGLVKGLYKGNLTGLAARLAEWLDPRAVWVLPLLGAWVFVEVCLLGRRVMRGRAERGWRGVSTLPGQDLPMRPR